MFRLDPLTLAIRAIVLILTIPVHEAAHAYVADKLGDPTGRHYGRLTLNPMAHFDLTGSIMMLLTGIGWAKPVPVNPLNFRESKKGMAITAAAGPASNLILAFISLILAKLTDYLRIITGIDLYILFLIFSYMATMNVSLAIFNLMPFPPFDGSRIFNYFLSDRLYFKIMQYEQQIFMVVLAMLMFGLFDLPLSFVTNIIYRILLKFASVVDVIFLPFV